MPSDKISESSEIARIKLEAAAKIEAAPDLHSAEHIEKEYLGRKGKLTAIFKKLHDFSPDDRKELGIAANDARGAIKALLDQKKKSQGSSAQANLLFDKTEPGKPCELGHLHVLTRTRYEIEEYFIDHGFTVAEGPEIETDYYNFEALNIPKEHPARDMWDTFYLKSKLKSQNSKVGEEELLLRTHTSPMQIRVMEKQKPPLAVIVPGRTYRHEATDARHEHTIDQLEGFLVDRNVTAANLKYILHDLFRHMFGKDVEIKLRPSYFPFTEPSFELVMACPFCKKKGCQVCGTGWLEMLGSGMINPKVFEAVEYPAGEYSGFAFGLGISRIAMVKYGIPDIRMFYQNDLRVLKQF